MYKFIILQGAIISVLIFCIGLSGCAEKKSDEAMIQAQIESLQAAIENHDRGNFMDVIDEHYQDRLNINRQALQRMLMGFFFRYKDISVYVSGTQISVQQIRADAQSQIVVTGGQHLIPENARHYQVHSCWKKVSDEWLLSCLEWQ